MHFVRSNERNLTRDARHARHFFFPTTQNFTEASIQTMDRSIEDFEKSRIGGITIGTARARFGLIFWSSHRIRRISAGEEAGPDIKKKVLRAGCLAQLRPPRPANCLLPGLITSLCYSVNARRKPLCLPRLNSLSHVPTHTI